MSHEKAGKYACYEYERKFLLTELPVELKSGADFAQIEDRYFADSRLRLRTVRTADGAVLKRKLTQKYIPSGADPSKTVITTMYLSETEMNLLEQLQGYTLFKTRYQLSRDGQIFAVDVFAGSFAPLILAEIEFATEAEMKSFVCPFPEWKEVTADSKYLGGMLAATSGAGADQLDLVKNFWNLFSEQKWDQAATLLHERFQAVWPQSREKMTGAKNFIDVNRYYPGKHKIEIVHAFAVEGKVLTTVWIEADTGQKTFANSIFEIYEGRILRIEEYWAEPYPAPEWRSQWVELY